MRKLKIFLLVAAMLLVALPVIAQVAGFKVQWLDFTQQASNPIPGGRRGIYVKTSDDSPHYVNGAGVDTVMATGSTTLQQAYDNSGNPAQITETAGKRVEIVAGSPDMGAAVIYQDNCETRLINPDMGTYTTSCSGMNLENRETTTGVGVVKYSPPMDFTAHIWDDVHNADRRDTWRFYNEARAQRYTDDRGWFTIDHTSPVTGDFHNVFIFRDLYDADADVGIEAVIGTKKRKGEGGMNTLCIESNGGSGDGARTCWNSPGIAFYGGGLFSNQVALSGTEMNSPGEAIGLGNHFGGTAFAYVHADAFVSRKDAIGTATISANFAELSFNASNSTDGFPQWTPARKRSGDVWSDSGAAHVPFHSYDRGEAYQNAASLPTVCNVDWQEVQSNYLVKSSSSCVDGVTQQAYVQSTMFQLGGPSASRPTCSVSRRGTFWITQGGAGVTDEVFYCMKSAADTYNWIAGPTGG